MESIHFTPKNCQLITDDSCCLSSQELQKLNVIAIPYHATASEAKNVLKTTLRSKDFVLFVGTAQSLSPINDTIRKAAEKLDEKDKSLNATKRVLIFNTSSFSGGLGFFVTLFSEFIYSGDKSLDDAKGYAVFLANHIAHFFIEPSTKRWNNLIYVPRTGVINFHGGKFKGNKGIYSYLAESFKDQTYHDKGKVWVCHAGRDSEEARNLAKQIKAYCPDSEINLTHKIAPNVAKGFSSKVISCFYLGRNVRPDEPDYSHNSSHLKEIEEKRAIAKKNITAISKYAQAYIAEPHPEF
ncbi:hypothetical protein J6X90_01220 [Candidatus Saccharibacteria bacterium]|nr:hypothetical protein [Candidatus Saccharibacteria bacterium]